MDPELAAARIAAPDDPETDIWRAASPPHGALATGLQRVLRRFASDFEVNARLGMYSLHLGGTATYRALLERSDRAGSLLDVGAGTGEVTEKLAPLFSTVRCTETSAGMARRIRGRGLPCELVDLADVSVMLGTFDAVALLNVLDRTSRPRTLLDRALAHLRADGVLILASPLPARPHVDHGGATADPEEDMGGTGETFEAALSSLHRTLLVPRDLRVVRWMRLPYLSQGDSEAGHYEHDDVLMCCQRR